MKIRKIAPVIVILLLLSIETYAGGGWYKPCPTDNPNNGAVGAPLDGGFLALLGIAGVAYYGIRKKKTQKTE